MTPWDFIQRLTGKEFQDYVTDLLVEEYSDFRTIDDTIGDEGCDGLANKEKIFFQMYAPQGFNNEPHKQKKIRDKIGRSLNKFKNNPSNSVERIIFVIPCELAKQTNEYIISKSNDLSPVEVYIWGESRLRALSSKYAYIATVWESKFTNSTEHLDVVSAEAYKARNNIGAISKLLDKINEPMKQSVLSEDYMLDIALDPRNERRMITIRQSDPTKEASEPMLLNIQFNPEFLKSNNLSVKDIFDPFTKSQYNFDGSPIGKAQLLIGDKVIHEIKEVVQFKVDSVVESEVSCRLYLYAKRKLLFDHQFKATMRHVSHDAFSISKKQIHPHDFTFDWLIKNVTDKPQRMKTSINSMVEDCNANSAWEFMSFFKSIHRATQITLEINGEKRFRFDNEVKKLDEQHNLIHELAQKVKTIADTMDQPFPSILTIPITDELINKINRCYTLLKTGMLESKYTSFSSSLEKINLEFIRSNRGLIEGKEYSVKQILYDGRDSLLGVDIDVGTAVRYLQGKLTPESIQALRNAIERDDDSAIEIKFVPGQSNKVHEYFVSHLKSLAPIKKHDKHFKLSDIEPPGE